LPPESPAPAPEAPSRSGTKRRLLDAAERLFAERGFEGTSIRAVTQAAGVSVSAANYHFGSKQELLHATLRRRLQPANRRRIDQLEKLEAASGPAGPSVEAILQAYLDPMSQIGETFGAPDRHRQVAARLFSDPPEIVAALRRDLFGEVQARFIRALEHALPGSKREEIALGLEFVVGVMVHVIGGQLSLLSATGDERDGGSPDQVSERMLRFAASGLRHCVGAARETR
jgi:AcrR family transcriptional regulator